MRRPKCDICGNPFPDGPFHGLTGYYIFYQCPGCERAVRIHDGEKEYYDYCPQDPEEDDDYDEYYKPAGCSDCGNPAYPDCKTDCDMFG